MIKFILVMMSTSTEEDTSPRHFIWLSTATFNDFKSR